MVENLRRETGEEAASSVCHDRLTTRIMSKPPAHWQQCRVLAGPGLLPLQPHLVCQLALHSVQPPQRGLECGAVLPAGDPAHSPSACPQQIIAPLSGTQSQVFLFVKDYLFQKVLLTLHDVALWCLALHSCPATVPSQV